MKIFKKYSFFEKILFPPIFLNADHLQGKIKNKTILITGASFGIGEALAYMLAKTGANLILVARTTSKLLEVQEKVILLGGKALIFSADISKTEDVKELINFLNNLTHGVDIIVNNAGKSIKRAIMNSLERHHDFSRLMAINYLGPVQLLLSQILPLKIKEGHIINISTVNVLLAPAPYWSAYNASKIAFDNWFQSISPEIRALGLSTTSIYLPLVKTRMIAPTPEFKKTPAMNPEQVAQIICKTIIKKNKIYYPWWIIFAKPASFIFRRQWENIAINFFRKKINLNET